MEEKKSKYNPQMRYAKDKVKQIKFNFVKSTDADIIEKLEKVKNKTDYIKKLIRDDIAKGN